MPRVSVIIPAYNAAEHISGALESIFDQTFRDFEVIVVDDGSTDNTKEVVRAFQGKENVRYFYQRNGGQSSARNLGVREARGEYLAFLDADDLWMPEFLERMVAKMNDGFDWTCKPGT
jgi:glycosyltransferase involved in cell wall biosynthesis